MLPSLAERAGDVQLLAEHFLAYYGKIHGRVKGGFTEKAMRCLGQYNWPGNVRELENVSERAVSAQQATPDRSADDLPAGSREHSENGA